MIESDLSNGYLFLSILSQLGKLSEEEYERASDETDPDVVLSNFGLLARSLSSQLNIKIKQSDVANIVSETPGAAAALVMKLKRWYEAALDKKYSRAPDAYKSMIASQRPREFVREKTVSSDKTPKEQFLHDARKVLDDGVFQEIDMKCLTAGYETHNYQIEESYQARQAVEEAGALEARQASHDATMTKIRDVTQANLEKDHGITQKWMETMDTKRKRQVRDLQFELANIKIANLRRRNKNASLNKEQIKGFDAFEANMKRSGLGGNDGDANMSVSYEDMDNFTERIEEEAKKRWPSSEETSDFLTQLKVRTANNRQARYEKSRRKRRMQVEQASSNAASTLAESGEEDAEVAEALMAATRQMEEKQAAKEAHMTTVIEQAKESKEHIMEEAEKSIQALAESFDEKKEEILATRAQQLEEVRLARDERKAKKRVINTAVCTDVVADLVGEIFDGGGASKKKSGGPDEKVFDFSDVTATSLRLLELAKELADSGFEPSSALDELTAADVWLPYATVGSNVGTWSVREVPGQLPPPAPAAEPAPEGEEGEGQEEGKAEEETLEAKVEVQENGELQIEADAEPGPQPEPTYEFARRATFIETAQTVSESIVQSFSTCPPAPAPPAVNLDFSAAEQAVVNTNSKTVVVVTEAAMPSLAYWEQARGWIGGKVCLWDTVQAVQLALPLAPLLEGKKPTINFPTLLAAFCGAIGLEEGEGVVECPAALEGAVLPAEMLKTCKEALATAETIMKAKETVMAGGEVSATASGFTDFTCAILVGQTLAIRDYLRGELSNHTDAASLPAQLSALTIATRMFGAKAGSRCALFARVVDWFQQGGQKEGVPADETELGVAIASEAGVAKEAGGGGKKGKGKGKGTEEVVAKRSVLTGVVWVRGGASAVDTEGGGAALTEDTTTATAAGAILDAYSVSAAALSEEQQMQVDTQGWQQTEQYLLRFGQSSPPEEGTPEEEDYVAKPGVVPVYVMQLPSPQAPASEDGGSAEEKKMEDTAGESEEVKEGEGGGVEKKEGGPLVEPILIVNFTALVEGVLVSLIDSTVSPSASAEETEPASEGEDAPVAAEPSPTAVLNDNCSRLSALISSRRGTMLPADKMWLLHAVGAHPLDSDEAFSLHSSLCAARAKRVTTGGLLTMSMGTGSHGVEKEVQSQTAQLIKSMKHTDQRWFDLCQEVASQHQDGVDLSENTIETLVCRLGTIIDDRHMQWLAQLSHFRATGDGACDNLRNSLEVAVSLAVHLSAATLRADEEAVSRFGALFGSRAGYRSLPWDASSSSSGDYGSEGVDIASQIDWALGDGFYESAVAGMDESARAVWERAVESASAPSEGPASLEQVVRTTLEKETVAAVSRVVAAASSAINSARVHLDACLASVAATVRNRYTYEHSILLEWRRQLASEPQGSTAFLNQYFFGVSSDPQYDSIAVVSEPSCPIDVGEMGLSLPSLAAFARAMTTATDALMAQVLENAGTQLAMTSNDSTGAAAMIGEGLEEGAPDAGKPSSMSPTEMFLSVLGTASRSLLTSVSNLPKGWKNQSRVQSFVSKVLGLPATPTQWKASGSEGENPDSGRREQLAEWTLELVLTLLYAEIPQCPDVSYAARLVNTVNNSAGPTFVAEATLLSFGSNSALQHGWWMAEESETAKEATACALAAMVYACAVGADGLCSKRLFFLALSKAPASPQLSSFVSRALLSSESWAEHSGPLASLLNEGVHRGLALIAATEPVDNADSDKYRDYSPSAGSVSLTALMGPLLGAGALPSLVSKADPSAPPAAVSSAPDTFRALLARGVKLPPPPPAPEVPEKAEEEGEGEEKEEGKEEEAPAEESAPEPEPEPEPEPTPEPVVDAEPEPEVWESFVLRPAGVTAHSTQLAWVCANAVGGKLQLSKSV